MESFWQLPLEQLFNELNSKQDGISAEDAKKRLSEYGYNAFHPPRKGKGWLLFLSQFKSPLLIILIIAALLSFFLSAPLDASIICFIVFVSGFLGFLQERGALNALEKVLRLVENKTVVRRGGKIEEVASHTIVPGDVIILNAGDLIPADCRLLETHHLFVDESSLTGESVPSEKTGEPLIFDKTNAVFYGSMVISGFANALVIKTGKNTQYGHIREAIRFRPPETSFELGVKKFSFFLMEVTLFLVIAIFAFNIYFARPILESFLFSIALAVGLTPQLLPAIISVNLARGSKKMAEKKVIVKRLTSIENFGQMCVLCTDKTGTLTLGQMQLEKAVDCFGNRSDQCLFFSYLNAYFQAGYTNPLDTAILKTQEKPNISSYEKIDEIPYDFHRKRLSVFLQNKEKKILITKGALPQVLSICSFIESDSQKIPLESKKQEILTYFNNMCQEGFRTLAVAIGDENKEEGLTLIGFLHFSDPIKEDSAEAVQELKNSGVHLKILTGDQSTIAMHVASKLGLTHAHLVTGEELRLANELAFLKIVKEKNVFAEIDPSQKEQIILALRKAGHTVGYLGDGINDVAALHSADVGISVESGADAAKEAADIVLMSKDLHVLRRGVEEGRHTFANSLKYVYMATSANFGNMFSMAGASLFLPFLPLLPKQVLLTNLLTDFPEMTIATDRVDADTVRRPTKWDLPYIRRFMVLFGLLSSVFDFATFGVLLWYLKADEALFRTGWFIESVMSATLVVLVIRTRHPFFKSRPSLLLTVAIIATALGVIAIPFTPLGALFGFVPFPLSFCYPLAGILTLYLLSAEGIKRLAIKMK